MEINSVNGYTPAQKSEKMFQKLDANSDNGIDKAEFGVMAEKKGINADDFFNKYDANKDGTLSKEEASKIKRPGHAQRSQGAMMSQETDKSTFQSLMDALSGSDDDEDSDDAFNEFLETYKQRFDNQYGNNAKATSAGQGTLLDYLA